MDPNLSKTKINTSRSYEFEKEFETEWNTLGKLSKFQPSKKRVPVYKRRIPRRKKIEDGKILDCFLLLKLSKTSNPEDVKELSAESHNITSLQPTDFVYFQNIEILELSDNNIPLQTIIWSFPK